MASNRKNVNTRLLQFLKTGNEITPSQIRRRFNVKNVSARISDLRIDGNAIYLNERRANNGRTYRAYRLGTPRNNAQGLQRFGGRSAF